MAKRFIQPNWKELRKLPETFQRAWFYIWDKADESGVYYYDGEYMKLDLSLKIAPTIKDLSTLPECEILPGERILIKNFLVVNYKNLKPDYNPHKPAFRDLEKNQLILNSSLNQASLKLEDKDKDEEEEEDLGKSENPLKNKKQKKEENFLPPIFTDVERVFNQQGGTSEMAKAFFNAKQAVGWKVRGSPILDFAPLVGNFIINWNENKKNGKSNNSGISGTHRSARDIQADATNNLLKKLKRITGAG